MPNVKKFNFRSAIFWSLIILILVMYFIADFSKYPINGAELNQNPQKVIQSVYPDKKISLTNFVMKDSYVSSHSRIFLLDSSNKQFAVIFVKSVYFNRYSVLAIVDVTPSNHVIPILDNIMTYQADLSNGKIHVYNKQLIIGKLIAVLALLFIVFYYLFKYFRKKKAFKRKDILQ